jgi:hypothetical protein
LIHSGKYFWHRRRNLATGNGNSVVLSSDLHRQLMGCVAFIIGVRKCHCQSPHGADLGRERDDGA